MAADFSVTDLQKALEGASDDIKREMGGLIDQAAHSMLNRIQQRYPAGPTGNLRAMAYITQPKAFASTSTGVSIPAKRVRSTAPHIHIWQEGTRERFDATRGNARRGRMPVGGKVFETAAAETRANMLQRAQAMLDRKREL